MNKSIGIDLAMDSSVVAVVDGSGRLLERETLAMDRASLARLGRRYRGCRAVLEVGGESGWVSHELQRAGLDVRCVNARRLRMVAESTLKTDELDAEVLARLARISTMDPELLPAVQHRSEQTQRERSVSKARAALVRARTMLINTCRGLARTMGHPLPKAAPEQLVARARAASIPAEVLAVLEPVLQSIEDLTASIRSQDEQVLAVAKRHPIVEALREIDGVGLLTATWFVLCVEDPHRFQCTRDIGSYFGLRPRLRRSGTTERRGHVTKEGDAEMRRLLVQAAHCLLRARRDSALKRWAETLVQRLGRKRAIPAIARKLSVVMLAVWKSGQAYQPFPDGQPPAAATR